MASIAELEYLLGHALTQDEQFRTRLCKEPAATAKELDIELTDAQDDMLRRTSLEALNEMAELMPKLRPDPHPMWS